MSEQIVTCSRCEAKKPAGTVCWLCGADDSDIIMAEVVEANPYASPAPLPVTGNSSAYGIVVIALIIFLLVVMAALTTAAPGLAIVIAVIALPALIRTAVDIASKQRAGQSVSAAETSLVFLASVAGVIAACAAAAATFLVACTAICFGVLAMDGGKFNSGGEEIILYGAMGVSALVGLLVLALLWRRSR